MGAFSLFTRIFAPSAPQIEVNPRRCLRNRLRGNRCDLCLRICPGKALSYSDGSLHFAADACSNCMACTAVCPVDALGPGIDLQKIVGQVQRVGHNALMLSCETNRLFREDEILLPCLGIFSSELLVSVASAAAPKKLCFNLRGCGDCRNKTAAELFQKNLSSLMKYSDGTHGAKLEVLSPDRAGQAQDDRRSFLRAMRRNAVNAAASSQPAGRQEPPPPATARTIPAKTSLLKTLLESHEAPHPLAARMVPHLLVAETCSPCPRCAGICPTGALKLVRRETGKTLVFDGTSCCGCGLCADFCKENALALSCSLPG